MERVRSLEKGKELSTANSFRLDGSVNFVKRYSRLRSNGNPDANKESGPAGRI